MFERLRFTGQVLSAVVSRTANRWYVALTVVVPDEIQPRKNHAAVGVDLGITALATTSDGQKYYAPKPLRRLEKRRRHLAKALTRCKSMYTKGWWKAKAALAKVEARIAAIRCDVCHKITTKLVQNCSAICLEDLNVRGMMANHSMAKALSDVAFGAFRSQVTLKALRYATQVVVAPRFFPSSKRCSGCGAINADLKLSEREWCCPACGECHDRDVNAALNLLYYMLGLVPAVAPGCQARRVLSAGLVSDDQVKLGTVKREPDAVSG